jgi:hypothetical protein
LFIGIGYTPWVKSEGDISTADHNLKGSVLNPVGRAYDPSPYVSTATDFLVEISL